MDLDDLTIGIIQVTSLSLSPDGALSLSLTLIVCPYIKRTITLAKKRKTRKGNGDRITTFTSPFAWLIDFSNLIALLDLVLELDTLVCSLRWKNSLLNL